MIKKIKDWGELTLKEKKKYGSKNLYYFRTNRNIFGVTDSVFQNSRKFAESVESDGIYLEDVNYNPKKNNEMSLELTNDNYNILVHINSRLISVGNYTCGRYFTTLFSTGVTHIDKAVGYIKKCLE